MRSPVLVVLLLLFAVRASQKQKTPGFRAARPTCLPSPRQHWMVFRGVSMLCLKRMIAGAALLLLTALVAHGQGAAFATISGHAQDLEGASVSAAMVTATNAETGMTRQTQTTSDGLYRFDNLPPGIYDLSI